MTIGPPTAPPLRIRCMVCDKPVDRVTWWRDDMDGNYHIKAHCHGDTDSMELTRHALTGLRSVDQLYAQEGQAFITKRICNEK